jgi:hypothetical protein
VLPTLRVGTNIASNHVDSREAVRKCSSFESEEYTKQLNLKTLTMSIQQKYHQARSGYQQARSGYQQARSASVGAAKGGSTAGAIIKQLIQQETKLSLENFYLLYKY